MNRKLIASLIICLLICLFAAAAHAADIGWDSTFDVARTIVLPEDGSGGIAVADAVNFNTGFTITAFFGEVAFYARVFLQIFNYKL